MTSILVNLQASLPAAGWTITSTTSTELSATHTSKTSTQLPNTCYGVDIYLSTDIADFSAHLLGTDTHYPGEWIANFDAPDVRCAS
jgi:hypothetical protein